MLQVFRLGTAQRKSSEEIYFPVVALNKGLDFLFIPIVCFVIFVKTYELYDLNLFIITVALVYTTRNLITGSDAGMLVVRPNPLNQSKYVVIVGGTTPRSMEIAARLRLTDLPDYVLFDGHTLSGKRVEFVDGGFFDRRWQIPK